MVYKPRGYDATNRAAIVYKPRGNRLLRYYKPRENGILRYCKPREADTTNRARITAIRDRVRVIIQGACQSLVGLVIHSGFQDFRRDLFQ